jgi:hypothetical protein
MKSTYKVILAAIAVGAVVGCGGSSHSASAAPKKSGVIGLWTTTSIPAGGSTFQQIDRLARPAVNEVFATAANNRHAVNDEDSPPQDQYELKGDIESFLTFPCNRSPAIRNVIEAVLVPDMMKADLSQTDSAAYLGVETGGATGGHFGGRKLSDDVVDTSLGIIFGNTIPALGLAPDDNNEIPTLTNDHVGASGKHFLSTFPYLGNPL